MGKQYSQKTTNDPPLWPILFLSTLASRCLDSMGAHKVWAADKPRCIASINETRALAHALITAQVSLTGRVTIRHNPPIQRYWHMGNNGIGILQTALLTYALGSILRYWSMRLQAYYGSVIVHYAPMRLRAYCKRN
jgi:hypothetical protein